MTNHTDSKSPRIPEQSRIIDAFMEIIAYTLSLEEKFLKNDLTVEEIKSDYLALIEMSKEKASYSGIKSMDWKRAAFPVIVWIDETILCSAWSKRNEWIKNQLQLSMFKTTNGGAAFYDHLEKTEDKRIMEVYMYCLALGFKGKFFSDEDMLELSEVKAESLLKYFSEDQSMNIPEILFPEAYKKEEEIKKKSGFLSNFFFYLFITALPSILIVTVYFLYESKLQSFFNSVIR